jgi:hypothetical protein
VLVILSCLHDIGYCVAKGSQKTRGCSVYVLFKSAAVTNLKEARIIPRRSPKIASGCAKAQAVSSWCLPSRLGLFHGPIHVVFVGDRVALGEVSL